MIPKYPPQLKVYADASFDKYNKKSVISWSCPFGLTSNSVVIYSHSDNNEAELAAVCLASSDLGNEVEIMTDSLYAIENFKGPNRVIKTNRDNTANFAARLSNEKTR